MLSDVRNVLTTLLDAYPMGGIFAFDTDYRYVFVGGQGFEGSGYSPEALIGHRALDLFPGAFGEETTALCQRCLGGERFTVAQRFLDRTYKVSYAPVMRDGEVRGGLAIAVDRTAEYRATSARDAATARARTLVQSFPGAAFLFDEEGRYLLAGGKALGVFGHDVEDLLGRRPTEVLGDEAGGFIEELVERALVDGVIALDVPTSVGRTYELRFEACDIGRGQRGVVATAQDVHEKRQSSLRTQVDLREKEALLREVHHRVKNHLQVVQSLLGMTARRVRSEAARRSLNDVRSRVQAMSVVHSELYRKADSSRVELRPFLMRLLGQIRMGLPNLGKVDMEMDMESLDADNTVALHLGLVLTELVSNAAEHAFRPREPGLLRVELRMLDHTRIELVVQDDGPGMPETQPKEDSLGLWLVRALTEPRGGSVIENGGSAGARWQVRIPVTADSVVPTGEGE